MESLEGKVAWVTGAGTGIGQAIACALAANGVTVVLSGRRENPLRETADMIAEADGEALIEALDVTDVDAVNDVAETIDRKFERLDILVNNAGINVANRHWDKADLSAWDDLIKTNVNGICYCVAATLPIMRRQRDGLIVNISSWAGRYNTHIAGIPYGPSKHAVLSLNASINMEESVNGIRACAICPGEVATPILDRRPKPPSAEERAKMLQPEDLAETVLFLARMPPRACLNEILISPTDNRLYR